MSHPIVLRTLLICGLLLHVTTPLPAADWGAAEFYEESAYTAMRPHAVGFYDEALNKTYVVFGDDFVDPNIIAYDHGAEKWQDPVQVGGWFNDIDYHCYPTMIRDATGRVHVFQSRINIAQYVYPGPEQLDVEPDARQMYTSAGELIEATYNMPVVAEDGEMLLFYRNSEGGWNQPWMVIRSQDNGDSWGNPEPVIKHDPLRADNMDTIYAVVDPAPAAAGLPERVLLAWTNAGPGADGNGPYNDAHKDAFFAYYSLEDHQLYAANGTALGDYVDDAEAEAHCKIYDSGPLQEDRAVAHLFALADTPDGKYTVGFADQRDGDNVIVCHWDGTQWVQQTLLENSESEVGDMQNLGGNTLRFFTADPENMYVYASTDSGATWTRIATVGEYGDAFAIEGKHHPSAAAVVRGPGSRPRRWLMLGNPPLPAYTPPPLEDRGVTAPEGALFFDSFENGQMTGWVNERGTWGVDVQDPRRVVRQGRGQGAARSRIVNGNADWQDYTVNCELEIVSVTEPTKKSADVGLLARYNDWDNHYGFVYVAYSGEYVIYKKVNGEETVLASKKAPFEMLEPYQWQAVLDGSTLEFWVNGEKILEAEDTALTSGKIALLADLADTVFDDVTVLPIRKTAKIQGTTVLSLADYDRN